MTNNNTIQISQKEPIEQFMEDIEKKYIIKQGDVLQKDIAEYLAQELDNSPTVRSRDAERLIEQTQKHDSISIYNNEKIIWFITIDVYPKEYYWKYVHERLSLRVDPNYRDKSLGKYLMMKITQRHNDQPIASYTPNEKVWQISIKYLGFKEVIQKDISPTVIEILEMWGPLDGEWYKFYMNEVLLNLMQNDFNK